MWRAGATLCCGAQPSHCSGFSCCRVWALGAWASVVVAHRLSSCGSQALEHRLGIVAHGLSCSTACGIFPDQGSNPCPLHWQVDSQPLCHQGSLANILRRKLAGCLRQALFLDRTLSPTYLRLRETRLYHRETPSLLNQQINWDGSGGRYT